MELPWAMVSPLTSKMAVEASSPLLDDAGVRALQECHLHLVRNGLEAMTDDFESDGINHEATAFSAGFSACLVKAGMTSLPNRSQLFHHDRVRGADGVACVDAFEARVHLLDLHKLLDNEFGWAAQPASPGGIVLDLGSSAKGAFAGSPSISICSGVIPRRMLRGANIFISS